MTFTTDARPPVKPIPVVAAMNQKNRRKRSKGMLVLQAVNAGAQTSRQIAELTGLRQHYVAQCLRFWEERRKIVADGVDKSNWGHPLTLWRPAKGAVTR